MNCKKYIKKAMFQKMTWLKLIPPYLKFYHVIGDETLDKHFVFDDESQILWVKTGDDYNSLPKKVIRAYSAVYSTFDFKYLFKTDDDQILVNNKFFDIIVSIINKTLPKLHYGGYIVDVQKPYLSQYHRIHPELPERLPILPGRYCSGRFYFLSRTAVSNLIGKSENIEKEFLEDYAIGYNLDYYFKSRILSLMTNNFFTDIELSDFPKLIKEGKL